jgi:type IV pilus assembly protein PilF
MFSVNLSLRPLTALLALLAIAACSSKKDSESKASLYFAAGTQSLVERQYTEALQNLIKANNLEPNNPEILNNLGMAYYFKGETELAVRTLKRTIELDENNSDAKNNLASIYYKQGNVAAAEKLYRKVLRHLTYDKQARTLYNLGILELEARKNVAAAENLFRKAVAEDDNYCPAYFQLGLIHYNRRQFKAALKKFKDAAMGPCYESPGPHYHQALALIGLRRFTDARLKLDEIDTRFRDSSYAAQARRKSIEINELESREPLESHASRNVLESPEF